MKYYLSLNTVSPRPLSFKEWMLSEKWENAETTENNQARQKNNSLASKQSQGTFIPP